MFLTSLYALADTIIANASRTLGKTRLDAAGLLALVNLRSIARWTARTGSARLIDVFYLAPGIHQQQAAAELHRGEYPPTGAMTSGYVFRVENEATVHFLQGVGKTGHLVNVFVDPPSITLKAHLEAKLKSPGLVALSMHIIGLPLSCIAITLITIICDWWALLVLLMLMLSRLCNVVVVKRRAKTGWKGIAEPGVRGDLIVLLSQDRWIRMRGLIDDLKAVTSGQWLRDMTPFEEFVITMSTLIIYLAAALAINSTTAGNLVLLSLLLISAGWLELINGLVIGQTLYNRVIRVEGEPVPYVRRLDLAEKLIKESGRDDWAMGLGMIAKSKLKPESSIKQATL